METGNGTAGDRDEQNWEQALALDLEANESRHVEHRVRDDDADDTAEDHAQKQEGTQIITRLHKQPHRQYRGDKAVSESNHTPGLRIEVQRELHADGKHADDEHDGHEQLDETARLELLDEDAEAHGDGDVEHRDCRGLSARYVLAAILKEAIERIRDDVGERRQHQQREEPAEKQEQAAARLADVLLDEHAHRLAFILDGSVQSSEVLHGTEEDAADQQPQQGGSPAEHGRDNRSGHRSCACNR